MNVTAIYIYTNIYAYTYRSIHISRVYIWFQIQICVYKCLYISVYIYICIQIYMYKYIYICIMLCVNPCGMSHIRIYVPWHIHLYKWLHLHTHTKRPNLYIDMHIHTSQNPALILATKWRNKVMGTYMLIWISIWPSTLKYVWK